MISIRRSALAFVLALAACSSSSSSNPPPATKAFDGTWAVCRNDGGPTPLADYREVFVIAGTGLTLKEIDYTTTDASCDGDGTLLGEVSGTATIGSTVSVAFGGGSVQATQVDVSVPPPGPGTFYTLLYRDTAAKPEILYNGDDSGVNDGSTPALRPTTLQDLKRALQTAPVAADLVGTWEGCVAVGTSHRLVFDATTLRAIKWDGQCDTGTLLEDLSFTYTLAEPVYVQHGVLTVTAFAADMVLGANHMYTTFWVDTAASPRALYAGDDSLHGMDGSTASLRPRVLAGDPLLKK